MRTYQWMMGVLALCLGFTRMAAAEVGEVRLATAHGIGYLPLIVMEHHKLFENTPRRQGSVM